LRVGDERQQRVEIGVARNKLAYFALNRHGRSAGAIAGGSEKPLLNWRFVEADPVLLASIIDCNPYIFMLVNVVVAIL
jgi:hypothetical protein